MTNGNAPNLQPNPSSINYREPAYFGVGALGNGGGAGNVTYNVQFPLRLIKNTAFSIDKDLYLGQTCYLKLYFGPISKVCYTSGSNVHPSAGVKAAYTGAAVISSLQLMLAVESNEDLKQ